MNNKSYFLLISCIFCFALFFYLKGIFLVKSTITTYSNSKHRYAPALNLTADHSNAQYLRSFIESVESNPHPRFNVQSVIFILIDALRPDFALGTLTPSKNYHNILSVLQNTNKSRSSNTLFQIAYSDPPTVTIQRIKGMMTGSLPTFIEFGDNFAAKSLQEDSLPNQVHQSGLNSYFVGDDTWEFLFPNRFNFSYPMDSFNVKDLDTVDIAVRTKLTQAVKQNVRCFKQKPKNQCYQFLVGHMLGVDHVGHYLHANHPEMRRKLAQINYFLATLIKIIEDSKTVLFVVSDHGMTEGGNHGGATRIQTESVFFTHSTLGYLLQRQNKSIPDEFRRYVDPSIPREENSWDYVSQLDYISTISAILGTSIPFINLGSVMLQALPPFNPQYLAEFQQPQIVQKLLLLQAFNNYAQISVFLGEYGEKNENRKQIVQKFLNIFIKQSDESDLADMVRILKKEKRTILSNLRSKWAQFDLFKLRFGTIMLVLLGFCLIAEQLFDQILMISFKTCNPFQILITLVHIEYCYSLFSHCLIASADAINPLFSMQLVLITAASLVNTNRLNRKALLILVSLLLLLKASRLFDQRLMLESSSVSFINFLKEKYVQFYGDNISNGVFTLYYVLLHSIFIVNILNNIISIRKHDSCALLVFTKELKEIATLFLIFLYSHFGDRNYAYLVYVVTGLGFIINIVNYRTAPKPHKLLLFILFLLFDLTHLLLLLGGYKSVIIIFILVVQLQLVYRVANRKTLSRNYLLASFTYYFALQGFYQTGHLTQFPTLQIANAFRGFEEFNKQIHSVLLLINTAAAPISALLYSSFLQLKLGLEFSKFLQILMKLSIFFAVITCVNTMWNREELHFTSDFAPKLLFEVGISLGFLMMVGILHFLKT